MPKKGYKKVGGRWVAPQKAEPPKITEPPKVDYLVMFISAVISTDKVQEILNSNAEKGYRLKLIDGRNYIFEKVLSQN